MYHLTVHLYHNATMVFILAPTSYTQPSIHPSFSHTSAHACMQTQTHVLASGFNRVL